jgi:hypothetical protein
VRDKPCNPDSQGQLQRYPVTASEFILIGKETERGQEQAKDISTLLPALMRYDQNAGIANQQLRERLNKMSLKGLTGGNRFEQEYHPSRTAGEESACKIASASPGRRSRVLNCERRPWIKC